MLRQLQSIDRRVIFLVLFIAISMSLMFPRKLSIAIEPPVQKAYDTLNELKPGDKVLMAFDYGPATMPEIHPAAFAMMRHCFERGARIVIFTTWNEGLPMIHDAVSKVCVPLGKQDNVDYVNLGFKWGGLQGSSVIEGLGSNMQAVFPVTDEGIPYEAVPLLKGVTDFKDFKALISLSAGSPGVDEYIQYANARYHIPIVAAVTKISAPKEFPFLESGQLAGLCSGIVGAAEYEELVKHPGFGIAGLFAQSVAHVVVVGFILLGNLIYFFEWSSKRRES